MKTFCLFLYLFATFAIIAPGLPIGTRSLLYGYHTWFFHPWIVARAWWKLYGFPYDPRLWVAFFVHDLGYWGKPNMDGEEGELHPFTGAAIMGALFDHRDIYGHRSVLAAWYTHLIGSIFDYFWGHCPQDSSWYCFTFYHSRFLSKRYGVQPSKLCVADKYAIVILPTWIQLLLNNLTGEIIEYRQGKGGRSSGSAKSQWEWNREIRSICENYVAESFYDCARCHKEKPIQETPLLLPPNWDSHDGLSRSICPACSDKLN